MIENTKKRKYMKNVSCKILKKVDKILKKVIPGYFNKKNVENSEGISKNNLLKIVK